MTQRTVLLADDDKAICTVIEQALSRRGIAVRVTHTPTQLLEWVKEGKGDCIITDVMMPGGNGLDALPEIKTLRPDLPVIVISARNTLLTAVKASQLGAYEYLAKPFDLNALVAGVEKALQSQSASAVGGEESEDVPIIGRSGTMQEVYRMLARLINVDLTVMITGESGTGKELVASAIHTHGARAKKPFIALNVAAIPKELIESELFGHEKGAFTGALARKAGAFERAEGGTLFLDEIGDMPLQAQTRLLRVLQQGEYTSVGGSDVRTAHVRIITATHRDISKLVKDGMFREDLYYRLNVVQMRMPALRERTADISELANHFLRKAVDKGLPLKELSASALTVLEQYAWPGNVRELEHLIYRIAALYASPVIDAATLRHELAPAGGESAAKPLSEIIRDHIQTYFSSHKDDLPSSGIYDRLLPLFEKPLIEVTLMATAGNQVKAANVLGINRNTLHKKIQTLGIEATRKSRKKEETIA